MLSVDCALSDPRSPHRTAFRAGARGVNAPVWLSCEVLRLRLDPTMATTRALRLERRFFPPEASEPSAVSDWLPSVRSRE